MSHALTLTRLCSIDDVEDDEPFLAEVDGFPFAIFQVGDEYFVTADECTHGPGSLSEGFVEDCQVECPFHQGRFDLRTGVATRAPCEIALKVWDPVVQDGGILIDISKPRSG